MKNPSISIIAPFYNEGSSDIINMFFSKLIPVLSALSEDWEIICIDDGSIDETYEKLLPYSKDNERIKIAKFARNFGKEIAISAGFRYSSKQCVIPMDSDLQDPVELIPVMIDEWKNGHLMVLAKRTKRNEGILKRIGCYFFYKILKLFCDIQIPENTGDYRLVDRKIVDIFNTFTEKQRYVRGLWSWIGFQPKFIYFERPDRAAGKPTQNYKKLIKITIDAVFSFSSMPLRVWTWIGLLIALISFAFGSFVLVKAIFFGIEVPGWSSTMVIITFLGGIQLLSIGVIGEYIGRIYNEVKGRSLYVVSDEINFDKSNNNNDDVVLIK